ncbi:BET1-like protein isoform X1, partial [Lates japonicus]
MSGERRSAVQAVSTPSGWVVVDEDKTLNHRLLCHGSVDDMLDAENKRMAENLATKVSRLKSLAYEIDREADDQNEYLDNM